MFNFRKKIEHTDGEVKTSIKEKSELEQISELINKMDKIKEINCLLKNFEEVIKPKLRFQSGDKTNLSLNTLKFSNCIFKLNQDTFEFICLYDFLIWNNESKLLINKESLYEHRGTTIYRIFKDLVNYYIK